MAILSELNYTNLRLKRPALPKVTEEEVEAECKRFAESVAPVFLDVNPARTLALGDQANFDFTGYLNGVKFPGGEAKGYDLVIGSGAFIPGFETGMLGMHPGEERDVPVTFPENYGEKTLAGKPAVFKVKLIGVKTKTAVEMTDELVKAHTSMNTVEEFKAAYREHLANERARDFVAAKNDAILSALSAGAQVEITKDMVDAQVDGMLADLERSLTEYGMTVDEFFEMNGSTREREIERVRKDVKENIKRVLIIEAIMEKENLAVSDEEVEEFLKQSGAPEDECDCGCDHHHEDGEECDCGHHHENGEECDCEHHHENGEECDCGHEHHHHHHHHHGPVDKEGVKTNLSYAKVLAFLDEHTVWEE